MGEYNKLTWFWKEFGLNKLDLEELNPEWIAEMQLIGLGVARYNASKAAEKPPQGTVTQTGRMQRKQLT